MAKTRTVEVHHFVSYEVVATREVPVEWTDTDIRAAEHARHRLPEESENRSHRVKVNRDAV